MIIKTRLKRRGNTLGFLIPEDAVKELGLIENQDVEFEIKQKTLALQQSSALFLARQKQWI